MKVVDGKLKVASENPRSLNPKGFQVISFLSSSVPRVGFTIYHVNVLDIKLLDKH